ncbi:MAG: permease [Paenibacillaceae bacterium]|jgi:sporulation integral membrane protein YtvI|nr:permease [Paenibacillaceae bacterium]
MNPLLVKQILRGAWVAVILTLIALCLYFVIPLVYPFIIGWLIAYMLNPLIRLLQRRAKLPRWLAVVISLLVFLGLAITLISFLVANIVVELGTLAETLQDQINGWKDQFINFLNSNDFQQLVDQLNQFYEQNPNYQNTINSNLSSTAKTIADFSSLVISFFFNSIVALVSALPKIATMALISLLASFFISKDWFRLSHQIADWFPQSVLYATRSIWADLQKALFGYLRAQLIMVSMTAVIVMTGLILLHVKYAVAIGLLVGIADLIPYVGTGAVMIPWILYSLLQGDIYFAVGLSINYGVGIAARQLLEPKVLASNVGLDPLPLLIAMFVGLKLFGAIGLIAGPVTLVLLYAFHRANVFRDIRTYIVEGRMKPVE